MIMMSKTFLAGMVALLMVFTGCTMTDSPLTEMKDQIVNEGQPSLQDIDGEECQFFGTVRFTFGAMDCEKLIVLDNGRILLPKNEEDLDFRLDHAQRIMLSFEALDEPQERCANGIPAHLTCAQVVESDEAPEVETSTE